MPGQDFTGHTKFELFPEAEYLALCKKCNQEKFCKKINGVWLCKECRNKRRKE